MTQRSVGVSQQVTQASGKERKLPQKMEVGKVTMGPC